MSTWLCLDLATALSEALERGTLDSLAGAEPVDEADRAAAYAVLFHVGESQRDHAVVQDLLARLAPVYDPYPEEPGIRTRV